MRSALAVFIIASAALGIAWEYGRWRMLSTTAVMEQRIIAAFAQSDPVMRSRVARLSLEQLESRSRYPHEVDLHMAAAAAFRLTARRSEAEKEYLAALRVSDRPEIHLALGNLYVETGDVEAAMPHYVRAVRFSVYYFRHIPAPHARQVRVLIEQMDQSERPRSRERPSRPSSQNQR